MTVAVAAVWALTWRGAVLLLLLTAVLRSLLASSNSVQMSLSRQVRLLDEATNEPLRFLYPFPARQYTQLRGIQRRIWCLVLTLEPALRSILAEQPEAGSGQATPQQVEAELFDVDVFRGDMRVLMQEVVSVLHDCGRWLETGQAAAADGGLDVVVSTVQSILSRFVSAMNEMGDRARAGLTSLMPSRAIVPITVVFSSAMQLAEQVLVLRGAVRRLIELERPRGYDD